MFGHMLNYISAFFAMSTNNLFPKFVRGGRHSFDDADGSHTNVIKGTFLHMYGVKPGKTFIVSPSEKVLWQIETFLCFHTVPCVGYGFREERTRLRDGLHEEIVSKLKAEHGDDAKIDEKMIGKEIGRLKKEGVEIDQKMFVPILAFLGDTDVRVFGNDGIFAYPTIMVECTFLMPEHKKMAMDDKHIHWSDLEPIVRAHPKNTFILYHFSMRHSPKEIKAFFKKIDLNNIVLWVE